MVNIYNYNKHPLNKFLLNTNIENKLSLNKSKDKEKIFIKKYELKCIIPVKRVKFITWILKILMLYHKDLSIREKFLKYNNQFLTFNDFSIKDTIETLDYYNSINSSFFTNNDIVKNTNYFFCWLFIKKAFCVGYINKQKIGRYYSKSFSIQNMSSNLRYLLLNGIYFDIDLKLSHISIFLDYATKYKIDHLLKIIPKYVLNKEQFVDECFTIYKKTIIISKKQFLIDQINKESSKKDFEIFLKRQIIIWLNINKIPKYETVDANSLFLIQLGEAFQNDIKIIRNNMSSNFHLMELKSKVLEKFQLEKTGVDKSKNFLITLQNFYAYSIENSVLDIIFNECKNNNIESCIPMFDGMLISKETFLDEEEEIKFVTKINEKLKKIYPCLILKHSNIKFKSNFEFLKDIIILEKNFNDKYNKISELMKNYIKKNNNLIMDSEKFSIKPFSKKDNYSDRIHIYKSIYNEISKSIDLILLEEYPEIFELVNTESLPVISPLFTDFKNYYNDNK